jgi:hypothetical protein
MAGAIAPGSERMAIRNADGAARSVRANVQLQLRSPVGAAGALQPP